jgi:hypothetical protein
VSENTNLVLISGKSSTGKSTSLMNIKDPEGVIYLNCENNKRLPFKSKFKELKVTDPMQVYQAFEEAENMPGVHTIIVDTLTYLMDMFESVYVLKASNGMKAWGDYAQYLKQLMSQYVANSTKNIFFLAHTSDLMNETEMTLDTMVKVKGSVMNQGVESFFSTVISTKKVPLKILKGYQNDYLNITPEEEALGYKYVFQTRLTKETVNERMRAPLGMWSIQETYIDNDVSHLINKLHDYYQ